MPTYEYRCPEGHEFEHFFRTISAGTAELACPICGKVGIRKVSGGSALQFKGSGFYITDYGKDGKKDQRRAGKPSGAESSSSKEGGDKASGGEGSSSSSSSEKKDSKGTAKDE